jgi:chemotaxis protein methyltransferase CheR
VQLESVQLPDRRRYFAEIGNGELEVVGEARSLVTFRQLNLVGAWPIQAQFDVIFCRNVVIYFDSETQAALWPRFHRALCPDGLLFIGHSERLDAATSRQFTSVGVTSYRKTAEGRVAAEGALAWH